MEILPNYSCVSIAVLLHHLDSNETFGEKLRRELRKDAAWYFERIIEVALYKIAVELCFIDSYTWTHQCWPTSIGVHQEKLPRAIVDRDGWLGGFKRIHASGTPWWSWWLWFMKRIGSKLKCLDVCNNKGVYNVAIFILSLKWPYL